MTYDKRYHHEPKGGPDSVAAIADTGDPYQNLANAVVAQAADDYRNALRYLKEHPEPPKAEWYLERWQLLTLALPLRRTKSENAYIMRHRVAYRAEAIWAVEYARRWRIERVKRVRKSPEYRRYHNAEQRWVDAKDTVSDCEAFFQGDWIRMLTKLKGPDLMESLRKEVEEEYGD